MGQQQPFYGPLSGTTRVSWYQKKHSPTTHHPDHHPFFISFFHLPRSIASSCSNYVLGNLFAQPLSFTLTLHIHQTNLISAHCSATSFSFLTGQVSLLCSILLRTQLLYSLLLLINDISLLASNDTNCLNLFHPIRILASASPSTLSISPIVELIHCLQICTGNNIHTCVTCTDYRIPATSTNK